MSYLHVLIEMLRNPGSVIQAGGYWALAAIVFLETGAMVFFLPGDSLLVVAGFYAAKGDLSLALLLGILTPLAILGDATSYTIGRHLGPRIFGRKDAKLLRPEHIAQAHNFYLKHGGQAIIIGRFMPIVRTFVPVVAGMAKMPYRRFLSYNVIGGAGWVGSMVLLGYGLGEKFPGLHAHVEKVILAVVFISLLPGIVSYVRERNRTSKAL